MSEPSNFVVFPVDLHSTFKSYDDQGQIGDEEAYPTWAAIEGAIALVGDPLGYLAALKQAIIVMTDYPALVKPERLKNNVIMAAAAFVASVEEFRD